MSKTKKALNELSERLTEGQARIVLNLADILIQPYDSISRYEKSDLVSERFLSDFGDYLRMHHCFSKQPFTKDKFEFAMEAVCNLSGVSASLAPTGNPGYDIKIKNICISLKTQADKNIKDDVIHISKFMELGKGKWSDDVKDLVGLRDQFFEHMKSYERIFTLRCLRPDEGHYHYELVEIPKALLLEASQGQFKMMQDSTQMPKPGYCEVFDSKKNIKFQLYFDGGGERKLQIKGLQKSLCTIHGEWAFSVNQLQ